MTTYTYILECRDGSYYVGSTTYLEARVHQHEQGMGAACTRRRLPVRLVWAIEMDSTPEAFALEKRIQNWSRAKRQALIEGRFEDLRGLAKKDFSRRRPDPS